MGRKVLLHVTEFPPGPGGIGSHTLELATLLASKGWELALLSPQERARPEAILEFNAGLPFSVVTAPPWAPKREPLAIPRRWYGRVALLRKAIASFNPDIVIAGGERAVWFTALARPAAPWIAMGYGGEFGFVTRWRRQMTSWAYGRADGSIAISGYTRSRMMNLGIKNPHEAVVRPGADTKTYRPLPSEECWVFRRALGLSNQRVILTVGSISERKGQELTVRALPHLVEKVPDIQFVMAGPPTGAPRVLEVAESLGVRDRIHVAGVLSQSDLVRAYGACDLFVMTSQHAKDGDFEGFGIAVVEAALCGRAAVVTAESGLAEAVSDGVTGLVVPHDPHEVAGAVADLLLNDEKRTEMEGAARRLALSHDSQADEYASFLTQVLGE